MSKMQDLYNKVAADNELQAKFTEIIKNSGASGKEATQVKLIAFAKEAGFDVSAEEIREFFDDVSKNMEGELSDTELDMVAGGKGGSSITPFFKKLWHETEDGVGDIVSDPGSYFRGMLPF